MKCILGLNHNYAKWSSIYEDYDGKQHQFRCCTKCSIIKYRTVIWMIQLDISAISKELKGL